MLEDADQGDPLLKQMCAKDSVYFKALSMFKYRSTYANISNDLQVSLPSSFNMSVAVYVFF